MNHLDNVSYDSIYDFLKRERFTGRQLWGLTKPYVLKQNDAKSHLICDYSAQDKRYSRFIELVKKQYSGNEHGTAHCHCLISLGIDQNIQKIIQLIKGESSFWINKNRITEGKFEWQDDYFAVSISESMVEKVRDYIRNQEEHHKTKTFAQEYDEFILKYGFDKFKAEDY